MASTDDLEKAYSQYISTSLKDLIENRHLYQSVSLTDEVLPSRFRDAEPNTIESAVLAIVKGKITSGWHILDPARRRPIPSDSPRERMAFDVLDMKVYCKSCGRTEAFNAVAAEDFLSRERQVLISLGESKQTAQVFVLSFQCQSCKGTPEVFMVRRTGNRLTLSGRAPIEHIEVPSVVPKELRKYYSGAIIAHHSGYTLAGNFMMRVVVEQWVRSRNPSRRDAPVDELLQEYLKSLPADFKSRFPSLSEVYSRLSSDIHAASGSQTEFERSRRDIVTHFDARRVYKLDSS